MSNGLVITKAMIDDLIFTDPESAALDCARRNAKRVPGLGQEQMLRLLVKVVNLIDMGPQEAFAHKRRDVKRKHGGARKKGTRCSLS